MAMTHVRLVGPADDGRAVLVSTEGGERFTLAVTEELKRVVSRADDGVKAPELSPREVQRRIRAGFTAEELADLADAPVASIERYVGPVLAERAYIAELARATRVSRDIGAPSLGDVVTDRLASRGIGAKSLEWDAFRVAPEPWKVVLSYPDGSRTVEASWTFDHVGRGLVADDEHSRWLSETELLGAVPTPRHLARLQPDQVNVPDVAGGLDPSAGLASAAERPFVPRVVTPLKPEFAPPPAPPTTDEILAELAAKRGTREEVTLEDDEEEFEGFGPQRAREVAFSVASGGEGLESSARDGDAENHTAAGAGSLPRAAGSDDGERPEPSARPAARGSRPKRNGRAAMPSWDEIVFGAKTD